MLRVHASRPLPRFFDIDVRVEGPLAEADGGGRPAR
jgi:hypothetical protein